MQTPIITLAAIGFIISAYALYVRKKARAHKNYKPLCDLHPRVSCTRALASNEGALIGISNSTIGLLFYALVIILTFQDLLADVFKLTFLATLVSLYLAYVLIFTTKQFCVVCISSYLINVTLLILSYNAS